eukprot:scaffold75489_cov32-Tisochrysis_lutea.AAC.1
MSAEWRDSGTPSGSCVTGCTLTSWQMRCAISDSSMRPMRPSKSRWWTINPGGRGESGWRHDARDPASAKLQNETPNHLRRDPGRLAQRSIDLPITARDATEVFRLLQVACARSSALEARMRLCRQDASIKDEEWRYLIELEELDHGQRVLEEVLGVLPARQLLRTAKDAFVQPTICVDCE